MGYVLPCIIVCLFFINGCNLGVHLEKSFMRDEAIKAGVAHWTIDSKTGETKFKYKTDKE